MSIFRKSGMVNVKMVITEEKILSNIDKIQKLINPNSKKQIVKLEEDSYFKDLVESIKTYLLEYPKKKNFPKNVYKAAYELVEYATNEFEENTKKIEKLIRKREKNIKLGSVLKDVTEAVKAHAKNWKEIVEKLSKKYPADVSEALYIIGNSKDKESEEYINAEKLIQAKIKNLEQNFHIEIDMERIDDRSKALSYIGIEIAEALKYIPAPAEEFISDNEVEKVVPIQDIKVSTQDAVSESVAAKIETEVMVQPKPRVAVQIVEEEAETHDEEQEANVQASETIEEVVEVAEEVTHEESNNSSAVEASVATAEVPAATAEVPKATAESQEVPKRSISGPVGRIDELTTAKEEQKEVAQAAPAQPVVEQAPQAVPVPITVTNEVKPQQPVQKPVQQQAVQAQPVAQVQQAAPVQVQQQAAPVQVQQQVRPAQPVNQVQQRPVAQQQMMNGYAMRPQMNNQQRPQYYGQYNQNYQQYAAMQNQQFNQARNQYYGQQYGYYQNPNYNMNQVNQRQNANEFAQSGKGKRFNKKPSLWQRIKNSKIGKKISYLLHIRLVVQYPELPEGQDK